MMAYLTRRGAVVAVPASSFRLTGVMLWLGEIMTLPFLGVPVLYALLLVGLVSLPDFRGMAPGMLGVGVAGFTSFLFAILAGWCGAALVETSAKLSTWGRVKLIAGSRLFFWLAIWASLNALMWVNSAWVMIGPARPIGLISLPLASFVAFIFAVVELRANRRLASGKHLYEGFSRQATSEALVPWFNPGPGADFPDAPSNVVWPEEAALYASKARRRRALLEHGGFLLTVVASAFIGTAGIWAFSGRPGPQIWVFMLPVGLAFAGTIIQRRHKFYEQLAKEYEQRRIQLLRHDRTRGPRRGARLSGRSGVERAHRKLAAK